MPRCYTINDPETGEPLAVVRGDRPPTDEDIAAVQEFAAFLRDKARAEDPDDTLGQRQREVIARIRRKAGLESGRAADTGGQR